MKKKANAQITKTITLPNGKRKYVRGKTLEEVEEKLAIIKAEIGAGVNVGDDITVTEMAQMWYTIYKKPHLKVGGQRAVQNTVNNHILPYIGAMRVRDVRPVDIRRVMAAEAGMSNSLQQKTIQALRGIFKAAVENETIIKSPVPESLKSEGYVPDEKVPLTTAQSKQLLTALRDTRAYVCVAIMLGTGLRREEVCGLMWSDFDFADGTVTVNRVRTFYKGGGELTEDLKSDAAHRTIPMPTWLTDVLKAEQSKSESLYVLHTKDGGAITQPSFKSLWYSVGCREADDPKMVGKPVSKRHPNITYGYDFHVYPHKLRHTCITRWFEAGLDVKAVQYLAGHASPEITLKIYAHYLESERRTTTAQQIRNSAVLAAVGA